MATYDGYTLTTTENLKAGDIINFAYKGNSKNLTLAKGVYKFECWGAQGGNYGSGRGGFGGYSVGTLNLQSPQSAYIYAGGQPTNNSGGFNGGSATNRYGYGGGGGSDIRIIQDSLYARIIVAGGGGSNGYGSANLGGYGGGTNGGAGKDGSYQGGRGGTQTTGGTCYSSSGNGKFGEGGYLNTNGGGAGGGWYGGGHGYGGGTDSAGGGGSGFVWTGANAPSGYLLNSSYHLTDAKTTDGSQSITSPIGTVETGHTGNGYVRITVVKLAGGAMPYVKVGSAWKEPQSIYVKVGSTWKEGELFVKVNNKWVQ